MLTRIAPSVGGAQLFEKTSPLVNIYSFAFRSLCFRRCCLYAANSGTEQLAVHVYRATLFPQRSNKLRSFSSFAANNNSRSYSAVLGDYFCNEKTIAKVIRRQRRNPAPLKIE